MCLLSINSVRRRPGGRARRDWGPKLYSRTFALAIAAIAALTQFAGLTVYGDPAATEVAPSVAPLSAADASETSVPTTEKTYVVQRGDSLSKLSERFGIPIEELAKRNGLRVDSLLPIGLELVLSEAAPQEPPSQSAGLRYYVVQKGDCLWTIARRYDTTAPVLARMNGLRLEDILPVGLRLVVPTSAPGVEPARFVETALRYQGVRYRWGGMTTRGMDCSGLVARVLELHGIDAPHNSRELYKLGVPVSRENLQAGDLVFFNTNGRGISHVGMYLGEGEFIHASSARGEVRIDELTEGYYQRRYVGARRVE